MLVGPRGDLRQVGDHQHLVPLRHLGERRAHLRPDLAADALIHLVEHQRRQSRRARASTTLSASIRRESSPPDATLASGLASSPTLSCTLKLHALLPVRAGSGSGASAHRQLAARQAELAAAAG